MRERLTPVDNIGGSVAGLPAIAMGTVIGLVMLASLVWTIVSDMGTECVRWSNRIEVRKDRPPYEVRVCAERQPPQYDGSDR